MTTTLQRRAPVPVPDRSEIAADRLDGAAQISLFLCGKNTPEARKKVFRLTESRAIPVAKLAGRLVTSRRTLTEHYRKLTSGAGAAE
jgi:hypothetical protein